MFLMVSHKTPKKEMLMGINKKLIIRIEWCWIECRGEVKRA